jgi:hypothetical protein
MTAPKLRFWAIVGFGAGLAASALYGDDVVRNLATAGVTSILFVVWVIVRWAREDRRRKRIARREYDRQMDLMKSHVRIVSIEIGRKLIPKFEDAARQINDISREGW